MFAVVTLKACGESTHLPIESTNESLAEAVNYLTLKKLAFGSIATYTIQSLDGRVYFAV